MLLRLVRPQLASRVAGSWFHTKASIKARNKPSLVPSARDEISICGLPVFARIGEGADERKTPQPLTISLFLHLDLRKCGHTDKLKFSIDYSSIHKAVSAHCLATLNTEGIRTIEALAHQIAKILIIEFGAPEVSVSVHKPGAVRHADGAAVLIHRSRDDFASGAAEHQHENHSASSSSSSFLAYSQDSNNTAANINGVFSNSDGDGNEPQSSAPAATIDNPPVSVFLAIGSNLGNRQKTVSQAVNELKNRVGTLVSTSHLYETAPAYVVNQPPFLNCACHIKTKLPPPEVLRICQDIERQFGRASDAKSERFGPRTLDIDILLYGQQRVQQPDLEIPHPRLSQRAFALAPLVDIDPDLIHPVLGKTVSAMLEQVVEGRTSPPSLGHIPPCPSDLIPSEIRRVFPWFDSSPPPSDASHSTRQLLPHSLVSIMGILNVTPDSFADTASLLRQPHAIARRALEMEGEGAHVLDVGGESSRPGATRVSEEEEMERVCSTIETLHRAGVTLPISVDTVRPAVARAAIGLGAALINDVSAGTAWGEDENGMIDLCAKEGVPLVLMHHRGNPQTMSRFVDYRDVSEAVRAYLVERVRTGTSRGLPRWGMLVDPGIGFAKKGPENLEILRHLDSIISDQHLLGISSVLGVSRKTFLGRITAAAKLRQSPDTCQLVDEPSDRDVSSAAAVTCAVAKGINVIRTHNVGMTRDAVSVASAIYLGQQ